MLPDEVFRQILEAAYKNIPEALAQEPPQPETSAKSETNEEASDTDLWDDSKLWESDDLPADKSFETPSEKQETLRTLWGSDEETEMTDSDESLQNTS